MDKLSAIVDHRTKPNCAITDLQDAVAQLG